MDGNGVYPLFKRKKNRLPGADISQKSLCGQSFAPYRSPMLLTQEETPLEIAQRETAETARAVDLAVAKLQSFRREHCLLVNGTLSVHGRNAEHAEALLCEHDRLKRELDVASTAQRAAQQHFCQLRRGNRLPRFGEEKND